MSQLEANSVLPVSYIMDNEQKSPDELSLDNSVPIQIVIVETEKELTDNFCDQIETVNQKLIKTKEKISSSDLIDEIENKEFKLKKDLFSKLSDFLNKKHRNSKIVEDLEMILNELDNLLVNYLNLTIKILK